jgi:type III restriction enzyme
VFNISDFTTIRPHDIRDNACIIVGTIQTLRVDKTEGRKVYAHNENMEPHFSPIPKSTAGLEQRDGSVDKVGDPRFSFANLLHVHRPLMIVDEAHNAVTDLTRDMQARINPCAIIEFTATPRLRSNILYSVTAQELKAQDMIKLPIILAEHDSWQTAVNGAIVSRAALSEAAKEESAYIRPIVLFQAQPRNQEVTTEVLKKHLIEVEQIPEDRIAIATGDQRGLDGIDLFDPKSRIEYIITIEALKEGWDCSFAYVFCSVSRIQSATDVEQLLGRVLRMPYAQRRKADALNRAYAHVSEPSFGAAAKALTDKLISMGFDEEEAGDLIKPAQLNMDDTGLFGRRERAQPVFRHAVEGGSDVAAALASVAAQENVSVVTKDNGLVEIAVTGRVAPEVEAAIKYAIPEPARKAFAEAVQSYRIDIKDELSPAERGEIFQVPRLVAEVQGNLEFADIDVFMEDHDWSLTSHPARLDEAAFAIRETARSFEIDVDGNRVSYQFASEAEQLALDVDVEGWSQQSLVNWLGHQLRQDYIHPLDLQRWLSDSIGHLVGPRKIHIAALMRTKFILARKLRERLAEARLAEQQTVYQRCLFAPGAHVEVSFGEGFTFREGMYRDVKKQAGGRWKPRKHFLGPEGLPAFDGVVDGEEFQCAQAIDSLPMVKFWLRNVAKHPESFWLPLAGGKFYPDFVARLDDERLMVIEYKGALLAGPGVDETNAKRAIGWLWEQRSGGKGLFLTVEKQLGDRDMRTQLLDKVRMAG